MFSEKCFITVWLQSYSERYKNKSIKEKEDIPSHPVEKSFVMTSDTSNVWVEPLFIFDETNTNVDVL